MEEEESWGLGVSGNYKGCNSILPTDHVTDHVTDHMTKW